VSDIIEHLEWAIETIRNKSMFGLNELGAARARESRAKGAMIKAVKEITKLKEALREAAEVVGFYAEEDNWEEFQHISLSKLCIADDDLSSHSYAKKSGGRRAREFQSRHAAIIAEINPPTMGDK